MVGLRLLHVFATQLCWVPIGGYGSFSQLVLPSLTRAVTGAGRYGRMMRSSMVEVLGRPRVVMRHALPSAYLAVIAMTGIDTSAWAAMLSQSVA